MAQYTPAPWRSCAEQFDDVEVINIYGGDGEVAATIHTDPVTFPKSYAVDQANARLIEQAPALVFTLARTVDELADARRIIAEFSKETGQYKSDLAIFDAQLESARALVNRIRGEGA